MLRGIAIGLGVTALLAAALAVQQSMRAYRLQAEKDLAVRIRDQPQVELDQAQKDLQAARAETAGLREALARQPAGEVVPTPELREFRERAAAGEQAQAEASHLRHEKEALEQSLRAAQIELAARPTGMPAAELDAQRQRVAQLEAELAAVRESLAAQAERLAAAEVRTAQLEDENQGLRLELDLLRLARATATPGPSPTAAPSVTSAPAVNPREAPITQAQVWVFGQIRVSVEPFVRQSGGTQGQITGEVQLLPGPEAVRRAACRLRFEVFDQQRGLFTWPEFAINDLTSRRAKRFEVPVAQFDRARSYRLELFRTQ